jgi:hypothetical protein
MPTKSPSYTHKGLDDSKRLFHSKVGVLAATIVPMVFSQPAFDVSAFDGKTHVAQGAALHDEIS